jgi:hypothetical protein
MLYDRRRQMEGGGVCRVEDLRCGEREGEGGDWEWRRRG